MTPFEYVTAAVLLIAGLGITRLLSSLVEAFRMRKRTRLDWIPLAWAGIVFVMQMQFLWAAYELSKLIESWTALKFVMMILLALLLFVSGALILPREPETEGDAFDVFVQDGRWALISLAIFTILAFLANPVFFGTVLFGPRNLLLLVLAFLLLLTFWARNRTWWVIGTLTFAVLTLATTILLSPKAYQ